MNSNWRRLLGLLIFPLLLTACQDDQEARMTTSVRTENGPPPVETPAAELLSSQAAFIEVSRKVTPAVVNIRAARIHRSGDLGPWFEEYFGDLFKDRPRRQRKEQSLGSGFLISPDGYILTNEHVIKGAEEIVVRLSDQRTFHAELVGVDPRTDVAVLKIKAEAPLPAVIFGDSEGIQVGQWALAIGNPFGLDRTLTVGVISATGRANVGIEDYEDFIQTDASINPGNSGGPLLNIYGEVIGINTAIVASGQGIGFAIPINLARLISDQLIEYGEVTRGWLGVGIQPMTPELAESFGLDRVTGALVNRVVPDSPAASAGLERGDVLLSMDGREIRGVRELQLLIASTPAGKTVELELLRNNRKLKIPVVIAAQEQLETEDKDQPAGIAEGLGLTVRENDQGGGLLVEAVATDSPAAQAGVREGDILLAVNRREVNGLTEFREEIKQTGGGKPVVLLIQRGESTLYLAFPVP